jgi:hypothetical protein
VDTLKNEVRELKAHIASMKNDMKKFAALMGNMMQNQQVHHNQFGPGEDEVSKKRRRLMPFPAQVPYAAGFDDHSTPLPVTSLPDATTAWDSDLCDSSNIFMERDVDQPTNVPKKASLEDSALPSLTPGDEEILTSLFAYDSPHATPCDKSLCEQPDLATSLTPSDFEIPTSTEHDDILVRKLHSSLRQLPENLQHLLVERMVAVIANPFTLNNVGDAKVAKALHHETPH